MTSVSWWVYKSPCSTHFLSKPPQGGVITEESFLSVFPELRNPSTLGIVIAAFGLGALVGTLSCLDLGDRLGRHSTVFLGMAFMAVGGTLQTSAWHVAQPTVGRAISGIGLGLQVATVPSWQSDCAKPKSRGRLGHGRRWPVNHQRGMRPVH
jgi:MFS family permease